jgi:hypothetical protein
MSIHLITVVGGHVDVLPFMLDHYRGLGIDSLVINVQLRHADDPVRAEARRVADRVGCDLASVTVGEWQTVIRDLWRRSLQMFPDDWCVLADQDELHVYPDDLPSLLAFCDRHGYDCVSGAFVDRLSADGGFPPVDPARSLWSQFPLGGYVSYPLLGADPRKIVAVKGRVPVGQGHHHAAADAPCPIEEVFVPVHHFKWTAGLLDRLRARADEFRRQQVAHWTESERFVQYIEAHDGHIDLSDERLLVAPCRPNYPFWPHIVEIALANRTAEPATR